MGTTSPAPLPIRPVIQTSNFTISNAMNGTNQYCEAGVIAIATPAALAKGVIVDITNNSGGNITITPAGTLIAPGIGTGARTLASPGICTLLVGAVAGEVWITGAGLT